LAARWFWRRRGLALGIAAVATSGGGLLVVPFLSAAIAAYGWRQALLAEAVILGAVIAFLAVFVVRDRPDTAELTAHSENAGRGPVDKAPIRWREVLATSAFWIPSLTLAAISGTAQAMVTLMVPYAAGLGHAAAAAALPVSAFAIAAAVTKIAAGVLADHLEQWLMLAAAAFFMALAWLLLSVAASYPVLMAAGALAGVALGCALPTAGALIAAHFSAEKFGGVMGGAYCLIAAAAIGAVRFSGGVFDRTGSYAFSFHAFAALMGCLLLATLYFARRGRAA
jgi:sugar phosphate permease